MNRLQLSRNRAVCYECSFRLLPQTVQDIGAFSCQFSSESRQVFNFPQILTLYDNISMAWGEHSSRKEQLTLALNILGHFLPSAEIRLLRGYSSKMALLLYKALAEEVVWTMPLQGGRIPLDELEEWVQRKVATCDIGAGR
ncbi:hypothetical protein [Allohahella sp. A8]|uniref:hypothetical protein n=1 Tax=Allohahella sp. A8 TaxID=3141461 RepID=UPI003A8091A0